ncbi:MAG: hypothetical protein KKG25_06335 [Bacteroidetes bacterium]|nr:hypothetical protein [Bacteroidota bacterium]MBU1484462.1 hypothetical protein [Bacteroidota bacterium]MBU2267437.1 hypothetical protein [Bacteroidota bacterium]MBU2375236.1 hypothetical protein [Bacteroidota bacterium]
MILNTYAYLLFEKQIPSLFGSDSPVIPASPIGWYTPQGIKLKGMYPMLPGLIIMSYLKILFL